MQNFNVIFLRFYFNPFVVIISNGQLIWPIKGTIARNWLEKKIIEIIKVLIKKRISQWINHL